MKTFATLLVAASMTFGPLTSAQAQGFGAALGGAIGASLGAASSGRNPVGGAVVGGIIGVAMGTILEQLTQQERASRQTALHKAARGKSSAWSSSGKKARYVNKGQVASADGKKCSKVQETITLPDGKRATSEETVCFT